MSFPQDFYSDFPLRAFSRVCQLHSDCSRLVPRVRRRGRQREGCPAAWGPGLRTLGVTHAERRAAASRAQSLPASSPGSCRPDHRWLLLPRPASQAAPLPTHTVWSPHRHPQPPCDSQVPTPPCPAPCNHLVPSLLS